MNDLDESLRQMRRNCQDEGQSKAKGGEGIQVLCTDWLKHSHVWGGERGGEERQREKEREREERLVAWVWQRTTKIGRNIQRRK